MGAELDAGSEPAEAELGEIESCLLHAEYERLAMSLQDARAWFRQFPELVTARQMPPPLAFQLSKEGYDSEADCNDYGPHTDDSFYADIRQMALEIAIERRRLEREKRAAAIQRAKCTHRVM